MSTETIEASPRSKARLAGFIIIMIEGMASVRGQLHNRLGGPVLRSVQACEPDCLALRGVCRTDRYRTSGGEFSSAFTAEQLQAQLYLSLRIQGQMFNMYMVFFGIWCLLTGSINFRSGFLPRLVGLLWPPLASAWHPYYLFFGVGELVLLLWLLVKGVDSERWHERALSQSCYF